MRALVHVPRRAPRRTHSAMSARSASVIPVRLAIGMALVAVCWWMGTACATICLRRIEHDALGRSDEPCLGRRRGVARDAALSHDRLYPGEIRIAAAAAGGSRHDRHGEDDERERAGGERQRRSASLVPRDEPHADQRARHGERDQDEPVPGMIGGERVVVADHREQHRQREIGVVHGALPAAQPVDRVGLASLALRPHQLALAGDDDEEHVRHHDRAEHRAEMDEGAAAAEDVGEAVRGRGDQEGQHRRERPVVAAEGRRTEPVVDEPAARDRGEADADRRRLAEIRDVAVDEVDLRAGVVDEREQEEARDPGPVGFPLEPVQRRGERGRGDAVFLRLVEAAAVNRPQLAADALRGVGRIAGRRPGDRRARRSRTTRRSRRCP